MKILSITMMIVIAIFTSVNGQERTGEKNGQLTPKQETLFIPNPLPSPNLKILHPGTA